MHSNIFPVDITFEDFQIQRIPFSEGLIEVLRNEHNSTHSFFRNGNWIYISPGENDAIEIGETVTLNIQENILLVGSLIKHIFFRAFIKTFPKRLPGFDPFILPSQNEKDNLLTSIISTPIPELSFKKVIEISFRPVNLNGKFQYGMVVNTFYKWFLDKNCLELTKSGFDLLNLEVNILSNSDASKGVVAPEEQSLGRVIGIRNGKAFVDTNFGKNEYPLSDLYLNRSTENVKIYLSHKIGERKSEQIVSSLKEKKKLLNNPTNAYKEITQIANKIINLEFKNSDGFVFNIKNTNQLPHNGFQLVKPEYIFNSSMTRVHKSPSQGLSMFGPYDYGIRAELSSPKILVICHEINRGGFETFLAQLRNGVLNSDYFPNGMTGKYKMRTIEYVLYEIKEYTTESYLEQFSKFIRNNNNLNPDIAIVETREEFSSRPTQSNPYYTIKAHLYALGIPVQFIKAENARKPDYIIDSFALQLYSKLGGTPWTMPSNQTVDRELIIGIGSSLIRESKYSGTQKSRVVGISTFFSADGQYIFSNKSQDVNYEDYFNELLQSLKYSLELIAKEYGWSEGDNVRIIFHVFKPMKNLEIDVVSLLVEQISKYNIRFSFVTFSQKHPFLLFDLNQPGLQTKYGGKKGTLVPQRGENFVLDNRSCLFQTKGPSDVKSDKQGISSPLLIKIHEKSTFKDLEYIVQQSYRLMNMSFRTFMPSNLPATLLYSTLIAKQLHQLRSLPGWNPLVVTTHLKFKKWFL
ncbi:Piwi domain-containing protein [Rufibacter glacialis]|uniref:Protein argonaute n=1 Tax=Rufibacter glacialis TaxID=1259555 RepID=A0A5M8QRZ6_9BACT|nr:Piwi domain-containing protein [Rufibacter glacialis]KAA6437810.1 hypothetical protein FOE74_04740 [Rufibacter glacialis]GGK56081.1 hypothetical protein GCM10011405_00250 [Rufibacter glacialis]